MHGLNLFVPITKIDEEKRLVYGVITQEVMDKSGEMLDYESSKPQFQKWMDDQHKASNGKSVGNLRAMHGSTAAGIFTDIQFDDISKTVTGCAHVVDDQEWRKCTSGTYTGFSIGGGYLKRWTGDDGLKRFTPTLAETSLVDNPCVPTALFQYVKADGSVEMRKFHTSTEQDMKPDAAATTAADALFKATPSNPEPGLQQGWQSKDGVFHVLKSDAMTRNREIEQAALVAPVTKAIEALDAAVTKAEGDPEPEAPADEPVAEPVVEPKVEPEAPASEKSTAATEVAKAADAAPAAISSDATAQQAPVKKGLYDVIRGAELVASLACFADCIASDAFWAGRDQAQADKVRGIVSDLAGFLREIVEEATADLMTADPEKSEKAADLLKFLDGELAKSAIEKLGKSADLPAFIEGLKKAIPAPVIVEADAPMVKITGERDALLKVVAEFPATVEKLIGRIEHLEARPAPMRGVTRAVRKGEVTNDPASAPVTGDTIVAKAIAEGCSPQETNNRLTAHLTKVALNNPIAISK